MRGAQAAGAERSRYQELTPGQFGLTGGRLRLPPHKEVPLHYHPAPLDETYDFVRGNGQVLIGTEPAHSQGGRAPQPAAPPPVSLCVES